MNRALVSVAYELHESRGKTRTARRSIDLDTRTVELLRSSRRAGADEDSYVFSHDDGSPIHPQVLSDAFEKFVTRSGAVSYTHLVSQPSITPATRTSGAQPGE